jgi:hypothetical protein
MYSIPNALVRSRIDNSPQLVSGLTLINELIANRLVPDGVYPIIAGGAVRDAIFQTREPHDIDIFLITTEGGLPRQSITDRIMWRSKARLFLEDFKEWAEAHGIETRSLLVEQDVGHSNRYAPGSSLDFIDILEIDYQGAKIQLMFNEPTSLGALAATFPSVCRGFLALNSLWFPSDGFYAMTETGAIPVCSTREVAYVHKKWPDAEIAFFNYDGHITDYYCWSNSPLTTSRVSDLVTEGGISVPTYNDKLARIGGDISRFFGIRDDVVRSGYGADFYRLLNSQWSANLQPLQQEPIPDISTDDTWAMPRSTDTRNAASHVQRIRSEFDARMSEFASAFGAGTNRVNQPAQAVPVSGGAGGNFGADTVSNRWHVEANQVIRTGSIARPWYTNPRTAGVNSINEASARRLGQINGQFWVDESDSIAD